MLNLKKICLSSSIFLFLAIPFSASAQNTTVLQVKGQGVKDKAVLVDGTVYTKPSVLEAGKKWKIKEDNQKWVVTLPSVHDKTSETVDIPKKVIDGNSYVDFSYFASQAGLSYEYNEKKKYIKLKKSKKEKNAAQDNVILLWDPDSNFSPDKPNFSEKAGRRIMSPTWGSYKELEGIHRAYNFSYLKAAKENHYEVMPLIHNDFDPDATSAFLKDTAKIKNWASRLAAVAEVYGLPGYNIDFENINLEDKDRFTQFIKTLSQPLHDAGKELSVDITVYCEGSPNWSLCYDRKALSQWADYQVVMGYDETPAASQQAGSVASYDWLDGGIKRLLQEIPPKKLVLGLPFYTRVWKGETGALRSSVLTLQYTGDYIKNHNLHPLWDKKKRQNVASWTENGESHKVWLEDVDSLYEKIKLGESYELAGVAYWRYGFESPDFYSAIEKKLGIQK